MRVNVNLALSGYGFLKFFSVTYVIPFGAARGCALGRPRKRGTGARRGGGEAPEENLSRGVSPKSSLTDKILSFRFHDPKTFHFTHINNYLKTKVIELRIILTIR